MTDLTQELAKLNAQAAELLAKYNGVFDRLEEEAQNKILEIRDKADESFNGATTLQSWKLKCF